MRVYVRWLREQIRAEYPVNHVAVFAWWFTCQQSRRCRCPRHCRLGTAVAADSAACPGPGASEVSLDLVTVLGPLVFDRLDD